MYCFAAIRLVVDLAGTWDACTLMLVAILVVAQQTLLGCSLWPVRRSARSHLEAYVTGHSLLLTSCRVSVSILVVLAVLEKAQGREL